ncbi:MAG: CPBP family intramembrane metalloprotease [Ignavibacteria bacterium]|nr:CPBP family intramembrane metalloprotease [Ignavibacteria bacterium]
MEKYNKPIFFYGLSLVIPWIFWFGAAYISHTQESNRYLILTQGVLSILGLLAPVFVALYLFLSERELYYDLKKRIFKQNGFSPVYTVLALLLIFVSMVAAQFISLLFGHDINQFYISGSPSFTSAIFSPWFILIFAPIVEELAWHSYGTDTLRRKYCLFNTSMIFALYWVFWHLPLSFIDGYYHSNVVAEGILYSLNFVFSLFVFVILMNWLYYKTNRNILIAILFHLSANISNEIFATHPDSKVIQTVLLMFVAIIVLIKDKKMFFSKEVIN